MSNENVDPVFKPILMAMSGSLPPEDISDREAAEQALKLAELSIKKNQIYLSGYKRLITALRIDGITHDAVRQIIEETFAEIKIAELK